VCRADAQVGHLGGPVGLVRRLGYHHLGRAGLGMCSKWAGGLGGSWTAVRGTGSHIESTNGESQGVVPFLEMHNDLAIAILDRLLHHATVISINGDSYRMRAHRDAIRALRPAITGGEKRDHT
jgi:hypothetical protein